MLRVRPDLMLDLSMTQRRTKYMQFNKDIYN